MLIYLTNILASDQEDIILDALKGIEEVSCVKFKVKEDDKPEPYVRIFNGKGCSAHVGRDSSSNQGYQKLTLSDYCLRKGTIMHEMLHALGFYHMQSTYNRDEFIRINYENIVPSASFNFNKYSDREVSLFGTPYDIDSVMHYGRDFFSRNGKNTLETVNPEDINRMGQRKKMSDGDIKRLNKMYNC